MSGRSIPNLPSRDIRATSLFYQSLGFNELYESSLFYQSLGFNELYESDVWLIVRRGDLQLEFFPYPLLDTSENWFSCSLRVRDLDALYAAFRAAGVPEKRRGRPRLQPIETQPWGQRRATLIDPDGTLLNLIEDGDDPS